MPWLDTDRGSIWYNVATPDTGGIDFQIANDASRVTVPVQVRWTDLNAAFIGFLGEPYTNGTPDGGVYISRQLPWAYPGLLNLKSQPYLFAQSVARVEGIGALGKDDTGSPLYQWARMYVVCASTNYGHVSDADMAERYPVEDSPIAGYPDEASLARYVSRGGDIRERLVSVGRGILKVVPGAGDQRKDGTLYAPGAGQPILESVGRPAHIWSREYVHHLRPEVPVQTILDTVGKVNDAPFDGFETGTLLCMPPKITPVTSALGQQLYTIRFTFNWYSQTDKAGNRVGPNYFLRYVRVGGVEGLDYRLATTTGTAGGDPLFGEASFDALFRPDQ